VSALTFNDPQGGTRHTRGTAALKAKHRDSSIAATGRGHILLATIAWATRPTGAIPEQLDLHVRHVTAVP